MLTVLRRLWPPVLALATCALVFYQFDWQNMVHSLSALPIIWLCFVLSAGALLVFGICAARWIAINQLSWRPSTMLQVHCYVSLSIVASLVTPFQLGELVKIQFSRKTGLKLGHSAVNLALERILDLLTIAAMGGAGLLYLKTNQVLPAVIVMIGLFLSGLATPSLFRFLVRTFSDTKFGDFSNSLVAPPIPFLNLLVVGITTILKWGLTLFTWMLTLWLADINLTILEGCFLLGAVTTVSIISMIPGGLGVQELSVRAILITMGIEPIQAETAAIALRLFTPVMVLIGLAHLPLLYVTSLFTGRKSFDV